MRQSAVAAADQSRRFAFTRRSIHEVIDGTKMEAEN
ncbi:hypothetical protein N184_34015 [Sinorhizobium sp. GL28]|nr:hypothetical protein N184_34015 [Sinorhizobium sp. GL28]